MDEKKDLDQNNTTNNSNNEINNNQENVTPEEPKNDSEDEKKNKDAIKMFSDSIKETYKEEDTTNNKKDKKSDYNKKENITTFLLAFVFIFILNLPYLVFLFNGQKVNQETTPIETPLANEVVVETLDTKYTILVKMNNINTRYNCDSYELDGNKLIVDKVDVNGQITKCYINTYSMFSITNNEYKAKENFVAKYNVKFNNGSHSSTYLCDEVIFMEDGENIKITTQDKELILHGEYIIEEIPEKPKTETNPTVEKTQ